MPALAGLSAEVRQKLEALRPATLAQAGRMEGMTPAALMLLLAHLRKAPGAQERVMLLVAYRRPWSLQLFRGETRADASINCEPSRESRRLHASCIQGALSPDPSRQGE